MSERVVQGIEIADGIIVCGSFLDDGTLSMTSPPIWVFLKAMGDIKNQINRLEISRQDTSEINKLANSTLDDLIADILIYLENRLKMMSIRNKCGRLNSIRSLKGAYRKFLNIDLASLSTPEDYNFLRELDIVRGNRHHRNERYRESCNIGGFIIKQVKDVNKVIEKVETIIKLFDRELDELSPIYEIIHKKEGKEISLEWTSIDHAFDITEDKIKIVPKKQRTGPGIDNTNISYFAIKVYLK